MTKIILALLLALTLAQNVTTSFILRLDTPSSASLTSVTPATSTTTATYQLMILDKYNLKINTVEATLKPQLWLQR